jgi:hypothetical protein
MVMIGEYSLYFDESYTHPPAPRVYTIAGYVSADAQWKKFQKEWRRILEAEGIEYFHMVDFQAVKQPYDAWSKDKRARFLASLHAIIHKRTLMSFSTTADMVEFESLTPEQKKILINPHIFAALNCMKAVGFWAAESILNHPMAYTFELGSHYQGQLKTLLANLSDEDRFFFRFGSLTFADKKLTRPLQAADMVAYESTKEIARKLDSFNERPARLSGINLGKTKRDQWFYCEKFAFVGTIHDAALRAKAYQKNKAKPA